MAIAQCRGLLGPRFFVVRGECRDGNISALLGPGSSQLGQSFTYRQMPQLRAGQAQVGRGLSPTRGSLKSWAEAICIDDTPRDEPPRRDETAEREGIPRRVIPPVVAGAKAPAMVAVAAKRTERRTIDSSVKNLEVALRP